MPTRPLAFSQTEYHVTSYFRSSYIEVRTRVANAASDGFGWNSSDAAFCLPRQLLGFLLPFVMTCVRCRSFVPRRRPPQGNRLVYLKKRTVSPRITQFYTDFQTDRLYS